MHANSFLLKTIDRQKQRFNGIFDQNNKIIFHLTKEQNSSMAKIRVKNLIIWQKKFIPLIKDIPLIFAQSLNSIESHEKISPAKHTSKARFSNFRDGGKVGFGSFSRTVRHHYLRNTSERQAAYASSKFSVQ